MSITIELDALLRRLDQECPHFDDGRIDYTDAREAAVVSLFVMHEGKLLLLERSQHVHIYKSRWYVVGAYIDRVVSVDRIVLQHLREELAVEPKDIARIRMGTPLSVEDPMVSKIWYIYPFVIDLARVPDMRLERNHVQAMWIDPSRISHFQTVPGLERLYRHAVLSQPSMQTQS